MIEIRKMIVHCSASNLEHQDSIEAIRDLHTSPVERKIQWGNYATNGNGWSDIGYHYVIPSNGNIETGRSILEAGAHCFGQNGDSIGICLTGVDRFTVAQIEQLLILIRNLLKEYNLHHANVYGHYEFDIKKTCPNMSMDFIRDLI